ncbi:MAG: Preprotein translocase SecG subunit [Verrucomicrobiota bacterium]|jgi:protein translocase SecG subunit
MTFIIGLLTAALVLNCLLLIFLVLIQLPKKEAGAGLAFGGGASDALFGAGAGNALTNITKWATGIMLLLVVTLAILNNRAFAQKSVIKPVLDVPKAVAPAPQAAPAAAPAAPTNGLLSFPAKAETAVKAEASAATNAPAAK